MDRAKHILICLRTQHEVTQNKDVPYRSISQDHTTIVVFRVEDATHFAAVQIIIAPFRLTEYPEQIFFSACYRYSVCDDASHIFDINTIERHVQGVYDFYFRPCPWNFSSKQCLIQAAERCPRMSSCRDAIETRVEDYMSLRLGTGVGSDRPGTYDVYELEGQEARSSTTSGVAILESSALIGLSDCEQKSGGSVSKPSDQAMTGNEAAVSLVARIRHGVATLARDSAGSPVIGDSNSPYQNLAQLEIDLWLQSENINLKKDPNRWELYWNLRILASNILLYRQAQTTSEDELPAAATVSNVSTKTRVRWRNTASILNMLVSGLWPLWGNKAYLLFEIIAKNQYGFKKFARLPRGDHSRMVDNAIEIMRDDMLPATEPLMDYHPAWLISSWTKQDSKLVCDALGLPSLVSKSHNSSFDFLGVNNRVSPSQTLFPYLLTSERPITSVVDGSLSFAAGTTPNSQIGDALDPNISSFDDLARLHTDQAVYRILSDMPKI